MPFLFASLVPTHQLEESSERSLYELSIDKNRHLTHLNLELSRFLKPHPKDLTHKLLLHSNRIRQDPIQRTV
jgi:hypothetical protein